MSLDEVSERNSFYLQNGWCEKLLKWLVERGATWNLLTHRRYSKQWLCFIMLVSRAHRGSTFAKSSYFL